MSDALVTVLPVAGYDKEKVIAAIRTIFAREKLSEKIRPGIRIFVKVNLVREMPPEKAATTHPVIVEAVCEELMAMGAEVTVGDSCGGLYTEKHMSSVYSTTGMTKACEESGAKLNADFTAGEVFCSDSAVLKSMQIINAFLSADAVINISKLKTHGLTGYSGAVKNLFGLIPRLVKVEMHSKFNTLESFCNCLIDIERFASEKIILHIIDGIVGMEGNGPTNGNPVELGVIAASSDAYLADAAALSIFTEAAENPVMECAAARGIVDTGSEAFVSAAEKGRRFRKPDFKKVDVKLNPSFFVNMPGFLKTIFRSSMSRKVRIVKDKCVGCGKCKMHCPGKAITITKHKAHIDQKKCIRCYCCQELCPKDAVAYRKALMTGIVRTFSGTSSGKIEKKK